METRTVRSLYLALSLAIAVPGASAQATAPAQDGAVPLPTNDSSDDIIVRALRIPRGKLPVQVQWDYEGISLWRGRYDGIQRYIGCAVRLSRPETLRAALDGDINGSHASFAQGTLVSRFDGCWNRIIPTAISGVPQTTVDLGRSPFHRGAIADAVLQTYAPDATLTREQTSDPEIRGRYMAREGYRNRLRLRNDLDALRVVSCMVEEQPAYATRIVRAQPGSELEMGLIQALIVDSRVCLGPVDRLTIQPLALRGYIVDSFYRWVVAARGVDTLITPRSS